ncbi:hypothetical protein CEXT_186841 [Caerostris extrusa]|uniref:Uncharacterized protein n=1 Tax=Caerostris extrusa TaxID=172846 RepID=A0AAV4X4X5_CAEEX|nr:hypothetical protein CEXT_186841 [Caerostris extrusa]
MRICLFKSIFPPVAQSFQGYHLLNQPLFIQALNKGRQKESGGRKRKKKKMKKQSNRKKRCEENFPKEIKLIPLSKPENEVVPLPSGVSVGLEEREEKILLSLSPSARYWSLISMKKKHKREEKRGEEWEESRYWYQQFDVLLYAIKSPALFTSVYSTAADFCFWKKKGRSISLTEMVFGENRFPG